jgi:hypothetical protein
MSEAAKKIDGEVEAYRKKVYAMKPEEMYRNSIDIIFTEGTAFYTKELTQADEMLANLVLVDGKTLESCAKHVMDKARSVCGGMGADLPTEQFHEYIWEFYKMPVEVAKTAIDKAEEMRKQESAARIAAAKANSAKSANSTKPVKKRTSPNQMSIFDMFEQEAGTADTEDEIGEAEAS